MVDKQKYGKEMRKNTRDELKELVVGNNTVCYNFKQCQKSIRSRLMKEPCMEHCEDRVVSVDYLKHVAIKRIVLWRSLETDGNKEKIKIRCDELKELLDINENEIDKYMNSIAEEI